MSPVNAAKGHRVLVYCSEDTISVYSYTYGWWCLDCPETRDPDTDGTTKDNAERDGKKHTERERRLSEARQATMDTTRTQNQGVAAA